MQGEGTWRGWFDSATLLPHPLSSVSCCRLGPVKFQPFSKLSVPSLIQRHLFCPQISYLLYSPHLCSLHHKSTVQAPLLCESSPLTAFLLLPLMNSTLLWLLMVLDNKHIIMAFFHVLTSWEDELFFTLYENDWSRPKSVHNFKCQRKSSLPDFVKVIRDSMFWIH